MLIQLIWIDLSERVSECESDLKLQTQTNNIQHQDTETSIHNSAQPNYKNTRKLSNLLERNTRKTK